MKNCVLTAVSLALPLLSSACGELIGLTPGDEQLPLEVRDAFEARCAECHSGATPAGGVILSGDGVATLEGAPSSVPGIPLLTRGDISRSYIALKMLEPDVLDVLIEGGSLPPNFAIDGQRMPLGGDLDSPDSARIIGWIAGAPSLGTTGEGDTEDAEDGTPGGSTSDVDTSGGESLSFAEDIYPLLARCTSCHGLEPTLSEGPTAAYDALVDVESSLEGHTYVVPGEPDASYLLEKIKAEDPGNRMPRGGEPLPPESVELVEEWIIEGARP